MRRMILLASVLLSVMALGSDSPKEYDDKTEVPGIEGTWQRTEVEENGRKWESGRQCVETYRSGIYTIKWGDGETFQGIYRIDPTRNPPHLDLTFRNYKGHTYKYICRIDGDTLRVARDDGMRRPQGFNDQPIIVETFKRVH